jgi:hypothetical protein
MRSYGADSTNFFTLGLQLVTFPKKDRDVIPLAEWYSICIVVGRVVARPTSFQRRLRRQWQHLPGCPSELPQPLPPWP